MSRTVSFQPLLFGGDINVYSVARAFHEAYGVKSVAFGKFHTFPCAFSSIIDYRTCPDNEDPAVFLSNVEKVALEFSHKTVIVLGCGDSYVQLCAHLKDQFPRNVVAPYIDGALLDRLINKEHFYELCDQHGIDHPATFIYDGSMGHDFTLPFGPPYVAKPADSVAYWEHEFEGVKKVFICQTWEELLHALDLVYASGYPDDQYGVCTDVVARALLSAGYDLKELVRADIAAAPQAYDIQTPDANIDFRRVGNLAVYFSRHAIPLTTDVHDISQWQGGDIVVFERHIGIVSDKRSDSGVAYVIHHSGPFQPSYEEDILEDRDDIIGHYRVSQ